MFGYEQVDESTVVVPWRMRTSFDRHHRFRGTHLSYRVLKPPVSSLPRSKDRGHGLRARIHHLRVRSLHHPLWSPSLLQQFPPFLLVLLANGSFVRSFLVIDRCLIGGFGNVWFMFGLCSQSISLNYFIRVTTVYFVQGRGEECSFVNAGEGRNPIAYQSRPKFGKRFANGIVKDAEFWSFSDISLC